jgi:hypothetical protein
MNWFVIALFLLVLLVVTAYVKNYDISEYGSREETTVLFKQLTSSTVCSQLIDTDCS